MGCASSAQSSSQKQQPPALPVAGEHALSRRASQNEPVSTLQRSRSSGGTASLYEAPKTAVTLNIKYSPTDLYRAASAGDNETVSALIQSAVSAGVDLYNWTVAVDSPLMAAAFKGHYETCAILIRAGVQIDYINPNGRTALWCACTGNAEDIARLLISFGADHTIVNSAGEPVLHGDVGKKLKCEADLAEILHAASTNGIDDECGRIADMCVSSHVSLDDSIFYPNGESPLMAAASTGSLECCMALVKAGSNINYVSPTRRLSTALWCACSFEQEVIARYLISAGADTSVRNQLGESVLCGRIGKSLAQELASNKGKLELPVIDASPPRNPIVPLITPQPIQIEKSSLNEDRKSIVPLQSPTNEEKAQPVQHEAPLSAFSPDIIGSESKPTASTQVGDLDAMTALLQAGAIATPPKQHQPAVDREPVSVPTNAPFDAWGAAPAIPSSSTAALAQSTKAKGSDDVIDWIADLRKQVSGV